ncbi:MAG: hypothetical protein NTV85_28650 [Hyphomicrobiales bacterium]|nr:hypothetical protein [Hyphomicrobiales bacterium]
MTSRTKREIAQADEIRYMTMNEVRALPGLLGRVASAMTQHHGSYGFVDSQTGRKVCIVLK